MDEFEAYRPHLHAVATRLLGSPDEADDSLQEAWLRVDRANTRDVENIGGWLTTVVSRVCLTMLDARRRRREEALQAGRLPDPAITWPAAAAPDPETEALAADALGRALQVVLETLQPMERLAFVLHDVFAVPFADIAPIVDRSPAAARQLASRARRRVQDVKGDVPTADRQIVNAFVTAARGGDLDGLLAVLDPNVVMRADDGRGELLVVKGARRVASFATHAWIFSSPYEQRSANVDGAAGVVTIDAGALAAVASFTITGGRITAIDALVGSARVAALGLEPLDRSACQDS